MSGDNEIINSCTEDYEDFFPSRKITRKINERQIRNALGLVGMKLFNKKSKAQIDRIASNKVIYKDNIELKTYQYYVTQETTRSRYPWYQISESHINSLKNEKGVKGIICLFFANRVKGNMPVFYKCWSLDEIENEWDESTSNGNKSYRWNPEKGYVDVMCKLETAIK